MTCSSLSPRLRNTHDAWVGCPSANVSQSLTHTDGDEATTAAKVVDCVAAHKENKPPSE